MITQLVKTKIRKEKQIDEKDIKKDIKKDWNRLAQFMSGRK